MDDQSERIGLDLERRLRIILENGDRARMNAEAARLIKLGLASLDGETGIVWATDRGIAWLKANARLRWPQPK